MKDFPVSIKSFCIQLNHSQVFLIEVLFHVRLSLMISKVHYYSKGDIFIEKMQMVHIQTHLHLNKMYFEVH